MGKRTKKQQVVFKGEGKSATRHVVNGRVRSLNCVHGVQCTKCFVPLEKAEERG